MNRAEFLRLGSAALVACRFGKPDPAGTQQLDRIGIQLYTVRREFAKDPEGTLARLAEIGYREVEAAGYPPGSPQDIRAMLQRHGLAMPSSHVGLQAADQQWERTLELAAELGQRYVVVAWVAQNERRTVDDWKRIATRFNQAGQAAQKHGLTFCYHNHDFEFVSLEGQIPYDVLLAETDPNLVRLEMDLYWITKGGKDPLDYFAKWPGRLPLVHVKDMAARPEKTFADVGSGTIDFARIFRRAEPGGIRHYFYEQDETPGDPFASAEASYRYLRGLRF